MALACRAVACGASDGWWAVTKYDYLGVFNT
jgi:hypothetical protein